MKETTSRVITDLSQNEFTPQHPFSHFRLKYLGDVIAYCCFSIQWHENRMQISVGRKMYLLSFLQSTVVLHIRWSVCLSVWKNRVFFHNFSVQILRNQSGALTVRYRPCIRSVTSQTKTAGTAEIENVESFIWILILLKHQISRVA